MGEAVGDDDMIMILWSRVRKMKSGTMAFTKIGKLIPIVFKQF